MKHRFVVVEEDGTGATVTHVYSDRAGKAVCHFDDVPTAWDWAKRQAVEDSACVLLMSRDGCYIDMTHYELSKSFRGLTVAAPR